ncbi:hypothetical protein [Pseudoalteromonas gelatinilytica]|nr:hypothetical protein [Pseudoalteromonas profundi]
MQAITLGFVALNPTYVLKPAAKGVYVVSFDYRNSNQPKVTVTRK